MSHISRLRKAAWVATCDLVFGAPFKTFIVSTAATAMAIYLPRILANGSRDKMMEALISLGWAVVANVAIFVSIFLVHFLYLAPKGMVEDANTKRDAALSELNSTNDA